MDEPSLVIEPLGSHHDRTAFSCGEPALDSYLQRQASQDVRRRVAQVFVAVGDAPGKIAGYYSLSAASFEKDELPPGLAKRDRLPPGLEKQLRERGTLPPGLQKRFQPLPDDLERQLPRLPAGYKRGVVAGSVILMNDKTSVIVDMIRNVIQ